MKKSLLLPICLITPAITAFAQESGVKIYGVVDTGVEYVSNVGPQGRSLTRMPSITAGSPSRLGFTGKEDLGGGLSAVFVLENGFGPDTGTFGLGGRGFGRQAWVGLSSPYGTLSLGRQYTMLFWSILGADAFGGSIYSSGSLDSYVPNARTDNSIAYKHTINGLTLGANYSLGRDTVNAGPSPAGTNCAGESATDTQACRQWSALVKYDTKAWGAALAYDTMRGRTPTSATDLLLPAGLTSSGKSDSRLSASGYVNISDVKIAGGLIARDNDGNPNLSRSNLWYLGATYSITPNLTLDGQWLALKYKNDSAFDASMLVARAVYSFSKRTAVYTQVGHINNKSKSSVSVSAGAPGSNPAAGKSQTAVIFGVRHTF